MKFGLKQISVIFLLLSSMLSGCVTESSKSSKQEWQYLWQAWEMVNPKDTARVYFNMGGRVILFSTTNFITDTTEKSNGHDYSFRKADNCTQDTCIGNFNQPITFNKKMPSKVTWYSGIDTYTASVNLTKDNLVFDGIAYKPTNKVFLDTSGYSFISEKNRFVWDTVKTPGKHTQLWPGVDLAPDKIVWFGCGDSGDACIE